MILFKRAKDLSDYIHLQKQDGRLVGFVPTMGALHQGHLSLIGLAKAQTDLSICSIFVNPTQFNNKKDFDKYPVTLEKDIDRLVSAGCDVLFLPSTEEIYPPNYKAVHYDLGELETVLEGKYRPGHFQGVCQVVDRLLTIVNPDKLFLGAKDYQQCLVINRLLELSGRTKTTTLAIVPTKREHDGLAMSSRNLRLTEGQRQIAPALYQSLQLVKENFNITSAEPIKREATAELERKGFKVDYLDIVNADTLSPLYTSENAIALVAAYLGEVRLIDNLPLR